MATLYRWRGNTVLAVQLTRDVMEAIQRSDEQNTAVHLLAQANAIVLNADNGNACHAYEQLNQLLAQLADQPIASEYVQIALLAAGIILSCGQELQAISHLRQCEIACEQGIARSIIAAEILNNRELNNFIRDKPEFSSIRTAVQGLELARQALAIKSHPQNMLSGDETIYSLRVLTLGDETVERDGVPITTTEWRSSRAKEFFLYILFQGAVSREELSLVFWPDSSPSRVRSNFHTTLYRARRALGENVILFEDELYRINPNISVWCDARVFERYVKQAQMLSYADVRADDLYRKATDYYQGDFLPDMDVEWAIPHREALYELHINALIGAGHCAYARQDFDGAIALFKHVLTIDPYRETAYRALFTCYAGMGELNHVLKQFKMMCSIFEAELGISPSSETQAYVKQLTQNIS